MSRFDRIVRSPRLLDANRYPEIVFQSKTIVEKGDHYIVEGTLDLHGVRKDLSFKFDVQNLDQNQILAKGKWRIKRKDFGIIWHKVLDYGGIIVGNHITINWELVAQVDS